MVIDPSICFVWPRLPLSCMAVAVAIRMRCGRPWAYKVEMKGTNMLALHQF